MKTKQGTYTVENYNQASTFASFLPGVSGMYGIPIWCYYVNRGQGVVSFGVQDKDHAIMEFYPAHQAYQHVKRTGFRTFIKKEGRVIEAFTDSQVPHHMTIGMNQLEISEQNEAEGLTTKVTYFTLPNEKVGALVRKVTIQNTSKQQVKLEVIDGMPQCIPYGVSNESMKNMGQTVKAWMQVEDVEKRVPFFRVRASMNDTATVTAIEEGNFSFGCLEDGTKMHAIVDPEMVFGYDTSLEQAIAFEKQPLEVLLGQKQVVQNQLPSSFYATEAVLEADKQLTFYEVIGQVPHKKRLEEFLSVQCDGIYFEMKQREAANLVSNLCKVIETKTGSETFDAYTQYTYMDNVLRGGYPVKLGENKIFYVYSRKHGDIERDYNYFTVLPEYYSQGNGNFRDVNQNRRLDNFFVSYLDKENIKMFYDCIQLDGYNPLAIEKKTYTLTQEESKGILQAYSKVDLVFGEWLEKPFTPGTLLMKLEDYGLSLEEMETVFNQLMDAAKETMNASFGEGYWSDHWTYNLDLIESYLKIHPEKEEALLFSPNYNYFLAHVGVNKRTKRYEKTEKGIRQYHAVDEINKQTSTGKLVRTQHGEGEVVEATLVEKLLLLCATKYATLDAYGMGVEMEGGKPGWYDALNGLPGLFGSSMAETYELKRNLDYTIKLLEKYPREIELFDELDRFIHALAKVTEVHYEALMTQEEVVAFWQDINTVKEAYREAVFTGIKGEYSQQSSEALLEVLKKWQQVVACGIAKACEMSDGLCPTYFTYEVTAYEEDAEGIMPQAFKVQAMPYFLEGAVRYLKLEEAAIPEKVIYDRVKASDLYDQKLSMYKVNASLKDASFEIGRAKSFTPGWLENESIWLHMEYKYLLEVLKSGLYIQFFEDFKKAAIPFLDPKVYGRSILENSSFIASSANPNEAFHGKGFVARLSGSTIEFLHMWQIMMFGNKLFTQNQEGLSLTLEPAIPAYLIGEDKQVSAMFLGHTQVVYQFDQQADYIPGNYEIAAIKLAYFGGSSCELAKGILTGKYAEDLRIGKVEKLVVTLKQK